MMIKQYLSPFIWTQEQKQLLAKVTMMMYLNQSIVLLYQTHTKIKEKIQVGSLIQS